MKYKKNNIFLKKIKDAKYPFFSMRIHHEFGLIEYDELKGSWIIYKYEKLSTYSKLNKLKELYKIDLNLRNSQDYFLNFVLKDCLPDPKKIDLKTAMIIHKIFEYK